MNIRVGCRVVVIGVSAWLLSLGLSIGSVVTAGETLEEPGSLIPEDYDVAEEYVRLGVDFFLADELDVAIDAFREAAHQKPDYADAYHNLGVTLAKTGDLTGAIAAWTEAERLDPSAVSLRYSLSALVSYNYGVSLVRDGRMKDAMKEWQTALGLQANFVEAHYALGLGFLAMNNPAIALGHFQSAQSLAPDWAQVYVALGQAHYESHEYDLARAAWLKALAFNPEEVGAYAKLGLLAVQEGNYQEAIDFSQQAIALQPDLVSAHFHVGVALLAQGESQRSVDAFAHALVLDARFTTARLLLGVAWSRMGDWAQAAHYWREALQLDPFGSESFWLHVNVGMALTFMGHFPDATKEFQWVVEQRPEWAQGWSQLGLSLMAERRWPEAVTALETAARLQPHWAHLHFSLGKAHAEQGELVLAVQAFREAVSIAPNFVDALFHLGLVLRAQNQLSAAIDPLRQAAEGGSRDAQGLLASMYVNGNGVDRNVPLAMLWWSRTSRASIPDTITRTAQNHLAQLRRRWHREQFTLSERQDVFTGFSLIRQDLEHQAPVQFRASARPENAALGNHDASTGMVLQWMIERALAMDAVAQQTLREWYVDGVGGQFASQDSLVQQYWLQVAKEGDPVGCELIQTTTSPDDFPAIRQACQSLGK